MTPQQEQDVLNAGGTQSKGRKELMDEAVRRAAYIISHVNTFKKPRLERIKLYRDLYAGKVKKKYRQQFNVLLPVFSGILDTLMADFNDDLALEFAEQEPADYLGVRKFNALWNMEVNSTAPNAQFAYKTRTDRSNALFSGRGFMMNYAESDPEYCNHFHVYELEDAIFQPTGGGMLEDHLYKGRDDIVRSAYDLRNGSYDQAQVKALLELAGTPDSWPEKLDDPGKAALTKYAAMALNPEQASYVGESMYRLAELAIKIDGVEYYLVFSPLYQKAVRFDKLTDIFSAGIYPGTSWATHEDNKNFLSKSYSDDVYGVADGVHTLFNQELTNREKVNNNPRAYDPDIFKDVVKLDQAQYRADALVPAHTQNGTRRIADGIYSFQVQGLGGTINLLDWVRAETGKDIGVTDISQGQADGVTKKVGVAFAEQNAISKRLLLRQSSYTEAMARIGKRFLQGAKDHLPAEKALKRLGIEGQGWDAVIRRTDLDTYGDIDVLIKSSAIEMKNSQIKKQARNAVLTEIAANPALMGQINTRWLVEEKLRAAGEYDECEIKVAVDTKNYGNKEETAYAHEGIQEVLTGKQPDLYYGATTMFMQIITDYAVNNRSTLGMRKYNALMTYVMQHEPIVRENMARKANATAATMNAGGTPAPTPTDPNNPNPNPTPPATPPAVSAPRADLAPVA